MRALPLKFFKSLVTVAPVMVVFSLHVSRGSAEAKRTWAWFKYRLKFRCVGPQFCSLPYHLATGLGRNGLVMLSLSETCGALTLFSDIKYERDR